MKKSVVSRAIKKLAHQVFLKVLENAVDTAVPILVEHGLAKFLDPEEIETPDEKKN